MKKNCPSSHAHTAAAGVIILTLLLAACGGSAPTVQSAPLDTQPPARNEPAPGQPVERPANGVDLGNPSAGLDQLTAYRQTLTQTTRSADGEQAQTVERLVSDQNESILVSGDSLYLFATRLDGFRYSQDQPGAACRAEPVADAPALDQNLAQRLPPVSGMQEAGQEQINGLPATHYTFDQSSLSDAGGVLQSAEGEAWLAQDSGLVLKYELTVQLKSADFNGSRSWSYQLEQLEEAAVILPSPCQPVLADLPTLPNPADVTHLPGFTLYYAATSRAEVVTFYYDQLTAQGWEALPGSAPEQADLSSAVTAISFARPHQDGAQVLVIQLSEVEGRLQVIAQSVLTMKPLHSAASAAPVEQAEDDSEEPPSSEPGVLPADLPEYPGATILTEIENMRMLTTPDEPDKVIEFFKAELLPLGWTLEQEINQGEMASLMFTRDGHTLAITVVVADGATQISVAAVD